MGKWPSKPGFLQESNPWIYAIELSTKADNIFFQCYSELLLLGAFISRLIWIALIVALEGQGTQNLRATGCDAGDTYIPGWRCGIFLMFNPNRMKIAAMVLRKQQETSASCPVSMGVLLFGSPVNKASLLGLERDLVIHGPVTASAKKRKQHEVLWSNSPSGCCWYIIFLCFKYIFTL